MQQHGTFRHTTVTCAGSSSTPVVAVAGSTGVTINVAAGASVSASHSSAVPFPILTVQQNSTITNNGTLSLSGGAGSGTNRGAAMSGNTNGNTLTNNGTIRFFDHHGVDERGIIRAFLGNLGASGRPQGGSSITQQVVKNLLVGEDVSYGRRKIREMIVASRLKEPH